MGLYDFIAAYRSRRWVNAAWRELRRCGELGEEIHLAPHFRVAVNSSASVPLRIGSPVWLDGTLVIRGCGQVTIGSHCSFRGNTYIGAAQSIEIGDHVYGAENVYICDNNNHPTSPRARRDMTLSPPNSPAWKWDMPGIAAAPIVIEDCVWLGRHSKILKGVRIGRGSIVAVGAVVTKSAPPFSVVAGNPARVVKTLENDLDFA